VSPERARLYFADPAREHYLVREVTLANGLDEAGRETLAQVIATSASAFVENRLSSSPVEVRASFGEPLPAGPALAPRSSSSLRVWGHMALAPALQKPTSPWQLNRGAFYSVAWLRSNERTHGPGAFVGVVRPLSTWRWLVAAHAQYRFAVPIAVEKTELTLRTISMGAHTALQRAIFDDWLFGIEAAMGVERTEFNLHADADSGVVSRGDGVHYRPVAELGLQGGPTIGELHLIAQAGVAISLARTRYNVGSQPIFTPWAVAPQIGMALSW
jgi:hypothetical protein